MRTTRNFQWLLRNIHTTLLKRLYCFCSRAIIKIFKNVSTVYINCVVFSTPTLEHLYCKPTIYESSGRMLHIFWVDFSHKSLAIFIF